MPIKKSELYASLLASCGELCGGDASQHNDNVLLMLFMKCVSDKYAVTDDVAPLDFNTKQEQYVGYQ